MPQQNNRETLSYIKTVCLEVPGYKYLHDSKHGGGVEDGGSNHYFVGRDKQLKSLRNLIESESNSGAYLITGYRGMGKSLFVTEALKNIEDTPKVIYPESCCVIKSFLPFYNCTCPKKRHYRVIKFSLNQTEDSELGVFRRILAGLHNKMEDEKGLVLWRFFSKIRLLISLFVVISFVIFCVIFVAADLSVSNPNLEKTEPDFPDFEKIKSAFCLSLGLTASVFAVSILVFYSLRRKSRSGKFYSITKEVSRLYDRVRFNTEFENFATSNSFLSQIGLNSKNKRAAIAGDYKTIQMELTFVFERLNRLGYRFIIVIDELDKLENAGSPGYYDDIETTEKKGYTDGGEDLLRARRNRVISLIASLKYFVNTCEARFVFVAGREMFDASLADVSDRQSSLGSVFHKVIYIDSFLKEGFKNNYDKKSDGGTGITRSIETLLSNFLFDPIETKEKKEGGLFRNYYQQLTGNGLKKEDAAKAIYVLQQFVIFLAYRSNGSPKKIIRLIEDQIYFASDKGDKKDPLVIYSAQDLKKGALYLRFSYKDQYRFGFINYLYRPFLMNTSRYNQSDSDHLLVMTPFLFDHILKFHHFAFSKRDFELLPEVVSSHRTPRIREYIDKIILWLEQNWIRDTEVGFHEYKFFHKYEYEIRYLTKMFDEEMAAMHFTFDETFSIKSMLRLKIKELRSIYKSYYRPENHPHINSISYENALLGDAHFFDEEYIDAVECYTDSLHSFQQLPSANTNYSSSHDWLLWARTKLKLAITFEKMNDFHSAISHYNDFIDMVDSIMRLVKINPNTPTVQWAEYYHMALLSKLYLVEKMNGDGVTLDFAIQNLSKIEQATQLSSLDKVKVYSQLGVLFFYKNGGDIDAVKSCRIFSEQLSDSVWKDCLSSIYTMTHDRLLVDKKLPVNALMFYLKAITNLKDYGGDTQSGSFGLIDFFVVLEEQVAHDSKIGREQMSKSYSGNVARLLSRFGDVLYTFHSGNKVNCSEIHLLQALCLPSRPNNGDEDTLTEMQSATREVIKRFQSDSNKAHSALNLSILSYLLSSEYYLKSGKSVSASFQYRKILFLLRVNLDPSGLENHSKNIEEKLIYRVLRIASWNSGSTDRPQVLKYKDILDIHSLSHPRGWSKHNYLQISNASELKEAILPYARLKVRSYTAKNFDEAKGIPEQSLVTNYSLMSTQFARLNELQLQQAINDQEFIVKFRDNDKLDCLKQWMNEGENSFSKWKYGVESDGSQQESAWEDFVKKIELSEDVHQAIKEVVVNSITVLYNQIVIHNTLGVGFFLSYSSLADCHRKLGNYLKVVEFLKINRIRVALGKPDDLEKVQREFMHDMERTIPNIKLTDVTAQYQIAVLNYYNALHFHNEGNTYKSAIKSMVFLEDDFSDHLYHFGIAFERQRINSGEIRKRIKELNPQLKESQLVKYKAFANTDSIKNE